MTSRRWYRSPWKLVILALVTILVVTLAVSLVSPWPAALLIRGLFESNAAKTVDEMKPYVPTSGLDRKLGVSYGDQGVNTTFDWFSPTASTTPLPTVVWIHGGAWISGEKENVDPYVEILAAHGYTTVSLNYTVSPEATYPSALHQLNDALAFLVAHATEYRIDPQQLVIAGDSAGAQYTSQLAALVTNPSYAKQLGMTSALSPDQLKAVILNCGIYDVRGIPDAPGLGGWGFRIALWAYQGSKDWAHTAGGRKMSTIDYVTKDFPATWISGGNGDPLTPNQSKPMAEKLTSLGVPVTSVFYPDTHTPSLPHEYQFHLKLAAARAALASTLAFLSRVTH